MNGQQYQAYAPDPMLMQQQQQAQPQQQASSRQDVIAYNQNLQQQSNRLSNMMQNLRNNPYLPSREQTIQIITTIATLLVMMLLGPAAGASAPLISSIVRQVVPMIVSYGVNYAADQTSPRPLDAPITNIQLQPVQAQQSMYGRAF